MDPNRQFTEDGCILRSYSGPGGKVRVPENISRIGIQAFAFARNIEELPKKAFCGCTSLREVRNLSCDPVEFQTFFGCTSLKELHFEPGYYGWMIERRGDILYVKAPGISEAFFIRRDTFLNAIADMSGSW